MSDCVFCQIIKGEAPADIVYQDDDIIAFKDISPKAPVHILICPTKHIKSLRDLKKKDKNLMGKMMVKVDEVAKKLNVSESGYKVVINNGKGAGQIVFHLHLHLVSGWRRKAKWEV